MDFAMWGLHVVFGLVANLVHSTSGELFSAGSFCIIDPSIPKESPGNSYYCPAYDEYDMPNKFTECCFEGMTSVANRKCCEPKEDTKEEQWSQIKEIGTYVGIATGCLLIVIFVFTYCRSDTYACVGGLQWRLQYMRDACLDAICFCDCFKSKQKTRRRLEIARLNQIEPLCDSQENLVVPMVVLEDKRQFWW